MTVSYDGIRRPHRDELSVRPDEDFGDWVARVRRFAVVDPDRLSAERRGFELEAQRRSEAAGRARRRVVAAQRALAASVLAAIVFAVLGIAAAAPGWLVVAAVIAAVLSGGALAVARRIESSSQAGNWPGPVLARDQVVRIAELDGPCRELLARAQRAVAGVLSSAVYQRGELDPAAGEAALRRHEWWIADELREISSLRAANDARPAAGPSLAAKQEHRRLSLARAQERTELTVRAIERYAEQVRSADAQFTDRESDLATEHLHRRFADLDARSAASGYARDELTGMTDLAKHAEEAYRHSIEQAHEAGAAVASLLEGPRPGLSDLTGQPDGGHGRAGR